MLLAYAVQKTSYFFVRYVYIFIRKDQTCQTIWLAELEKMVASIGHIQSRNEVARMFDVSIFLKVREDSRSQSQILSDKEKKQPLLCILTIAT